MDSEVEEVYRSEIDHPDTTLVVIKVRPNERKAVFTFDWSHLHWKNHYAELATIPNHTYYHLKDWEQIMKVANGTDSLTYALVYMGDKDKWNHIPFIAKLLVKYGAGSVKFKMI